nr:MAG: hypothetical protein [Bacteriophage sp.]
MTPASLLTSPDMYVLFDGCPTCRPENSKYLDECRTQAQKTQRRLHIVPSGSPTATLIRAIATTQGQQNKYPLILLNGLTFTDPQDIPTVNERTTK